MSKFFLFIFVLATSLPAAAQPGVMLAESGMANNRLSQKWLDALKTRMSPERRDSFASLQRNLTLQEQQWQQLISAKLSRWNTFRDSLIIPFGTLQLPDTIYVLMGYTGVDDGFTYKFNTVCLDLSALQSNYGDASLPENDGRIDRIFSHEFTHLIHKEWARKNNYAPSSFRDSILWECLYEGMGMYRSFSAKWLPVNGELPQVTIAALNALLPIFAERLAIIQKNTPLSNEEKIRIQSNLSRGPVNKKWGAFTIGIWLALEAKGNDKKLVPWLSRGPEAVVLLAKKYLSASHSSGL